MSASNLIDQCKEKLVQAKTEILNRVRESRQDLYNNDDSKGGDEGGGDAGRGGGCGGEDGGGGGGG